VIGAGKFSIQKERIKMGIFNWSDEYSIGIEKIDKQHQHLFEIINKLIECQYSPGCPEIINDILTEMINYARVHFTDEELLMKKYNYPEIEQQERQHDYFITTTADLTISFMDNRHTTKDEITEFLKLWLTNHILKTDMKLKGLLKVKMAGKA
jgi:hemerythrin